MKKLLLLVAIAAMYVPAQGQELGFGVKAGLNLANVSNVNHSDVKPSIYVGLFKEFVITDLFAIQPELLYSRQGFKSSEGGTDIYGRFNYLNLPVMAKFYVADFISVDFGPQFGYMLNARIKTERGGTTVKKDFDDIYGDYAKRNKFDVALGVGCTFLITNHIEANFRYNIGLSNAVKDDWGDKYKNNVFQFGGGYRF